MARCGGGLLSGGARPGMTLWEKPQCRVCAVSDPLVRVLRIGGIAAQTPH